MYFFYIYVIYLSLAGLTQIITWYSLMVNLIQGEFRNHTMRPLIYLLVSIILVSGGSLMTLAKYCVIAQGIKVTSLTSVFIWLSFVTFLTATNKRLQWASAEITMVLCADLIPLIGFLSLYFWIGFGVLETDPYYCALTPQTDKMYIDVIYGIATTIFQLLIMLYNVVMAYNCQAFLEKQVDKYPFLQGSMNEQKVVPIVISILAVPFFLIQNFVLYGFFSKYMDIYIQVAELSMQVSILIISVCYGFNPTLQKTTAIRHLIPFRNKIYQRFLNHAEDLRRKSVTASSNPESNESEMSKIDHTPHSNATMDMLQKN